MSYVDTEYELDTQEMSPQPLVHAGPERKTTGSTIVDLVAAMQDTEEQYVTRVRSAVKGLMDNLHEKLGQDFKLGADIQRAIQQACAQFDAGISAADTLWGDQRKQISHDLEAAQVRRIPEALAQEIALAESTISQGENHIQAMLRSTSGELATIMRARMRHSEVKAYLTGLRFQARATAPEDNEEISGRY